MKVIDFEIDDLPEDLRLVAEIIGLFQTKKLMVELSGTTLKFPKNYPPAISKKHIIANYKGDNINSIARELGVSRSTIYNYLSKKN